MERLKRDASLTQLLHQNREEILKLAVHYGASNVRLFGSVARGEADHESDIDLLVDFETGYTLIDRISLIYALEDLLGCSVDVVPAKMLRESVRESVLRDSIPL